MPSLVNVVIVSLLIKLSILLISDNLSKSYIDVLLTKFVIVPSLVNVVIVLLLTKLLI